MRSREVGSSLKGRRLAYHRLSGTPVEKSQQNCIVHAGFEMLITQGYPDFVVQMFARITCNPVESM